MSRYSNPGSDVVASGSTAAAWTAFPIKSAGASGLWGLWAFQLLGSDWIDMDRRSDPRIDLLALSHGAKSRFVARMGRTGPNNLHQSRFACWMGQLPPCRAAT